MKKAAKQKKKEYEIVLVFQLRQSYLYRLIIFLLSQNRGQTMTSPAR